MFLLNIYILSKNNCKITPNEDKKISLKSNCDDRNVNSLITISTYYYILNNSSFILSGIVKTFKVRCVLKLSKVSNYARHLSF